ncbi:ATPase [uncultured Methanobrevibacter sp.]|uniref:ATPase n=1 Tax=uncultured Methanobrevibacter sp. TaxID=253161 RepID=UPI00261E3B15|nr:ATPase [uncultured Methanobrevibacter sp.]
MNETTILVWINIAIIGIIAIIIVKLYFRKDEMKNDDTSLLPTDNLNEIINSGKSKLKSNQNSLSKTTPTKSSVSTYFSKQNQPQGTSLRKKGQIPKDNFNSYVSPETHEHNFNNKITYKDEEKIEKPINFNYETKVHKFQEPINESQMDIMSKTKKTNIKENENNISLEEKPKHELKDLFSIDELIKESKRKDNEREKESKTIKKEKEDTTEIKESIKQMKEGKKEENLITEVEVEPITETKKENNSITEVEVEPKEKISFYDTIHNNKTENKTTKKTKENNSLSITDAIKSDINDETEETLKTNETPKEETVENVLTEEKEETVADALNSADIKTPSLKTPTKIQEENDISVISPIEEDYEFGAPLEESEIFKEEKEEVENELSDLDYRKDLAKITNTIKNSKIFNEVKEKLTPEQHISEKDHVADEMYLRNVSTYEKEEFPEYEPIINERHEEYPSDYDYEEPTQEQLIRQENTRKVFNMMKNTDAEKSSKSHGINETPGIEDIKIKEKPAKSNIKIKINNEEVVLHKGDEIIFNHDGESYSSKVYGIRGTDISVKYRGKKIDISSKDIKKIY